MLCVQAFEICYGPGTCQPNAYRRYAWQVVLRSLATRRSMKQCSHEMDSELVVMRAQVSGRANSLLGYVDLQGTEASHEAASIYDVSY